MTPYTAQFWFCHTCGFETFNPVEKERHLQTTEEDFQIRLDGEDIVLEVEAAQKKSHYGA